MTSRILATTETHLKKSPLPSDHIISEHFDTGLVEFPSVFDVKCGLWDHPEGESRYIESDEVLVVLSGRAEIEINGNETLNVQSGDVVLFEAGIHTVWRVTEPLRKFWIVK
jgi:uncharacterized cupin superfamily protein